MKKTLLPLVLLFMVVHLAYEYFTHGVATHYLLADESLPGFSNWWGLLTIPLTTWFIISWIRYRDQKKGQTTTPIEFLIEVAMGMAFGLSITLLWLTNQDEFLQYWIWLPVLLSIFLIIHRWTYYLGCCLGMVIAFGGVLPLLVGLVLMGFCFISHHTLGRGWRYLRSSR
jgi:hypothetical protein